MPIDWDAAVLGPVMAVFGQAIIFTPKSGAPIEIPDAVFDQESAEIQIGTDGQASTQRKPTVGVRAAWFAKPPAQSDSLTIVASGLSYTVKDVEPDGHGHIRLILMAKKIP